jgi:hypothetical protein
MECQPLSSCLHGRVADPDQYEVRIRILLSTSKISKKNLDTAVFFDFIMTSLKNDVTWLKKEISKHLLIFVFILKVTEENGRIRSPVPKCHGSATLVQGPDHFARLGPTASQGSKY